MAHINIPQVGPQQPNLKNSPIREGEIAPATTGVGYCLYNDAKYSAGAFVCGAGRVLRCNAPNDPNAEGFWAPTGEKC